MAPALPDDFPVIERHAVRVVVLDTDDRVLLLHTWTRRTGWSTVDEPFELWS